jgi:hypothetical protein
MVDASVFLGKVWGRFAQYQVWDTAKEWDMDENLWQSRRNLTGKTAAWVINGVIPKKNISAVLACPDARCVSLSDSEGDMYDLFVEPRVRMLTLLALIVCYYRSSLKIVDTTSLVLFERP